MGIVTLDLVFTHFGRFCGFFDDLFVEAACGAVQEDAAQGNFLYSAKGMFTDGTDSSLEDVDASDDGDDSFSGI